MHTETHDQNLTPDSPALLRQTDHTLARIHTLLGEQGIPPTRYSGRCWPPTSKPWYGAPTAVNRCRRWISACSRRSPPLLRLAEQVVAWLDKLAYEEAHLLSVHFEVAKENELSSVKGES